MVVQDRWDVPDAEYLQPKSNETSTAAASSTAPESSDIDSSLRWSGLAGVRPSEGINAEELWKSDSSAKVRKSKPYADTVLMLLYHNCHRSSLSVLQMHLCCVRRFSIGTLVNANCCSCRSKRILRHLKSFAAWKMALCCRVMPSRQYGMA